MEPVEKYAVSYKLGIVRTMMDCTSTELSYMAIREWNEERKVKHQGHRMFGTFLTNELLCE